MSTADKKLAIAEKHLGRVQTAWYGPDWDHLSIYGFLCLEAAVEAAALHLGIKVAKDHRQKSEVAADLHRLHGLPGVDSLMRDLNDARKAESYGDIVPPALDPEDTANAIEAYVGAVKDLMAVGDGDDEEDSP